MCDPNKLTIDHYDYNKSRSEMPNKVDTMIFWWIRYVKFFKLLGISYFERDFIRTVQKTSSNLINLLFLKATK